MANVRVTIKTSSDPRKKYDAVIEEEGARTKTVRFGQRGASDYTMHKDPERKERYLARHRGKEDWNDYRTPGFWAARLLWNKPTIAASAADIRRAFPRLRISLSCVQMGEMPVFSDIKSEQAASASLLPAALSA